MASKQHHSPPDTTEEGPAAKRARPSSPSDAKSVGPRLVELNPADCDLDFEIDENGLRGHACHEDGFAYCWSGARATVGITGGKYCFGCKVISEPKVEMADTPPDQQHICRIGISRGDGPAGNLGETIHSFGFGGTGKFSNAGKFCEYGGKFGLGDTIVCAVDLESKPLASIGFSINGKWLGIAGQFDACSGALPVADNTGRDLQWKSALFPHVLLKNVVVQLQFSCDDGLIPEEGYKTWNFALEDGKAVLGPSFSRPEECEVLMMIGLPASGKTTWAEKWAKQHPEKRYMVLGTNLALDQMKVPGLLRKQNYGERFDRLMDRATGIFNALLSGASRTPRNYILEQTNVYKSARIRKLKAFVKYRKIAVVIFPALSELKHRADKRFREMGKEVPADAINEMLANYVLPMSKGMPGSTELFDEVIFPELGRGEAQKLLVEMKQGLSTPNKSAKGCLSPYSCGSSVQSFSIPSAMNRGTSLAFSGEMQAITSPASCPDRGRNILSHVGTPFPSPGSYTDFGSRFDDQNVSCPSYRSYSNHFEHGTPSLCGEERRAYGSHHMFDASNRNSTERYSNPICGPSPFQRHHGFIDCLRSPQLESPTYSAGCSYGYQNTPSPYSGHTAGLPHPGILQVDHNAVRQLPCQWNSPLRSTSGTSLSTPPHQPPPRPPSSMNRPFGAWYG